MSYDDPPEPTEEEIQAFETEQAAKGGAIRIEGLTRADVQASILGALRGIYSLDEKIDETIKKAVAKALTEQLKELTREKLAAAVDECIAEGWPVTDDYGRVKGKRHLKDFVLDFVRGTDRYDHPLLKLFTAAIERELGTNGELGKLLAEAKAKLRAMLDETIAGKFRGALQEALKP